MKKIGGAVLLYGLVSAAVHLFLFLGLVLAFGDSGTEMPPAMIGVGIIGEISFWMGAVLAPVGGLVLVAAGEGRGKPLFRQAAFCGVFGAMLCSSALAIGCLIWTAQRAGSARQSTFCVVAATAVIAVGAWLLRQLAKHTTVQGSVS